MTTLSFDRTPWTDGRGVGGAADAALGPSVDRTCASRSPPLREPLSPELVLVCPRLRLRALASLPERPWEAFLPPPPPQALPATVATPPVLAVDPVAAPDAGGRRLRRDTTLVLVALFAGFIGAQFVPRSAGPSFTETGEPAPSVRPGAAPAPLGQTAPITRPAKRHTGRPRKNVAVPRGGYVFGRSGRFQIAADRRTVRMFRARVRCARRLVIPSMSLHHGRRFSYRGQTRNGGRVVRFKVFGRFLDENRVRGFVRASSARCDSGSVRFLARLS
jgi:hypothetical protein